MKSVKMMLAGVACIALGCWFCLLHTGGAVTSVLGVLCPVVGGVLALLGFFRED